jgi:predicted ArsR family transcriptional regulator
MLDYVRLQFDHNETLAKVQQDIGMQETRQQILSILQRRNLSTVDDLARDLDLAVATVRHHLTLLERDGLVASKKVRQQVGRPYLVYSLSQQGQESFPKKYHRLSSYILTEVKAELGSERLSALLRRIAQRRLAERAPDLEGKSLEERLEILIVILGEEGFVADWEKADGRKFLLTHHTCPYQAVVSQHPEVCQVDAELISGVIGAPVERTKCILYGDLVCTFEVKTVA